MLFSKSTIGIEIDSRTIKLAHVITKRKVRSIKAVNALLNSEFMVKGRIVNEESITSELRHVLNSENIEESRAVITLPSSEVILRQIVLPSMPENELNEAIKWEAAQYIPTSKDDMVIDYKIIEQIKESSHTQFKIIIAGVLKETVLSYYRVVKNAGFKLKAIDTKSFSLLRGVPYKFLKNSHTVIIDFGKDEINAVISRNGIFQVARVIPNKQTKTVLDEICYNETLKEIRRLLSFYSTQAKGAAIEKVLISGDMIGLSTKAVAVRIQNDIGIQAKTVNWESGTNKPLHKTSLPCLYSNLAPIGAAFWGMNFQ